MKLILDFPINSLSFGNVSVNLLRSLVGKSINLSLFENGPTDLTAFDRLSEEFKVGISNAAKYKYYNLDRDIPTLKLWHINGSERRITPKQFLYTFYELDNPTFVEKKILSIQDHVFLSSPDAVEHFTKMGLDNVSYVPLGFDTDLVTTDEDIVKDKVHFILMGKFENRKRTKEIIRLWLKKYGNDKKYLLSCCITNPFLKPEEFNAILGDITEGKSYNNINFLPFLKTNSEVNHLMNSADIDLTGLSGAEGWNLPAFNCTSLGKWSIVNNHTGHKAWATEENCLLVQPQRQVSADDGLFFVKGGPFNQGNINLFDDDEVVAAMEKGVEYYNAGKKNEKGLELQKEFTYDKSADMILKTIEGK